MLTRHMNDARGGLMTADRIRHRPLTAAPLAMQILAGVWSIMFSLAVASSIAIGITALAQALVLAGIFTTFAVILEAHRSEPGTRGALATRRAGPADTASRVPGRPVSAGAGAAARFSLRNVALVRRREILPTPMIPTPETSHVKNQPTPLRFPGRSAADPVRRRGASGNL